jgi:hypothetical protein
MSQPKFYAFLDVVVDVFYSIILYNAFVAFRGFNLSALLLALSVFIMINYWWTIRSYEHLPKHYLFDFYAITIIMFIFAQWPNYYHDIRHFTYVLAIFFAVDAIYAGLAILIHKESGDEKSLKFYFCAELILAIIYLGAAFILTELTWFNVVFLFIPYFIMYAVAFKKGLIKTKFRDSGNQPY